MDTPLITQYIHNLRRGPMDTYWYVDETYYSIKTDARMHASMTHVSKKDHMSRQYFTIDISV